MSAFYGLKAQTPTGILNFDVLAGKVVLIVNVASRCGYTPHYKGLQGLYDKYKTKGLEILGFPSNQFGGQEPGTDTEIASFCEVNYGVNFPLMKKSDVNGEQENEVFKYIKEQPAGASAPIKRNFEKFLIDRQGNVVKRYPSGVKPEDIDPDIAALL
ncbi:glutathione peroxidase [Calocera viscosa TUFC12733]|uniref:Glutathione peroxidase n=1 Tax=Calocera viscosa (strain TUFC12733) TaxID=1330018 RepID=A0A167MII2_CALVF|nr:glutathione peroxidase [Calocera viscosa TUFC12733]